MSVKSLVKLLVVLAVLAGISILIPRIIYHEKTQKTFSDISQKNLTRIIITDKTQNEFILINNSGNWTVVTSSYTYRADNGAVENIVNAIGKLEIGEVISSNEKRHSRFEVNPASGTRVQFFADNPDTPAADFYIGKATPDYTTYYLRFSDEKNVHFATGFSRYLVDKKLDRWRNRSLGSKDREAIAEVILTSGRASHTLKRDGAVWKYNEKQVEQKDVDALLGRLTSLNASELVNPEDEEEIKGVLGKKSAMSLVIKDSDGVIGLSFFPVHVKKKEKVEKYHVLKKDENGIFIINEHTYKALNNDFNKIKEASLKPSPDESPASDKENKQILPYLQ